MALKKIGAVIALDGEKEYRKQITAISAAQKSLVSELKLLESQYKGNANSSEFLISKQKNLAKQQENIKDKVKTYKTALSSAEKTEEQSAKRVETLSDKLKQAKTTMSQMEKTTGTADEELKEQKQVVADLEKELGKAKTSYLQASKNTSNWQASLNKAEKELVELNYATKKNDKYLEESKKSFDSTAKSIDSFGNEVEKAKTKTSNFKDGFKSMFATQLAIKGLGELKAHAGEVVKSIVSVGSEFDFQMSKVQSLCGATSIEMSKLEKIAREMGATTKFTASECAQGLSYMALAGWDTKRMMEGLPGVVNLAAAANMDLASASDILTDAITAFGDSAKDSNRYADVLAKTQASSNTTVELLGESFKYAAASAGSFGFSLEDTSTALGLMANAGVKGSQAGTALNSIMLRLGTNTSGARDKLEEMGVSFYDNSGNARDFGDIIMELSDRTKGLTQEEKANVLQTIAGKRAYTGLSAIVNQGSEAYKKLNTTLENCNGSASLMAQTLQDNLQGDMVKLKSATQDLEISTNNCFKQTFRTAIQGATRHMNKLSREMNSNTGVGRSMKELSQAVGSATDKLLNMSESGLKKLINSLTWVVKNGRGIITTITGIGTGVAAWKIGNKISDSIFKIKDFSKAFKNVYQNVTLSTTAITKNTTATIADGVAKEGEAVATEVATVAQEGFNAALNANVIVAVATAIVSLGMAIYTYTSTADKANKKTEEFVKGTDELIESCKSSKEAFKESKESYQDNLATLKAEADVSKDTADSLIKLSEKANLSKGEIELMKEQIGELNSKYPNLNLSIDENTGKMNLQGKEIRKCIEEANAYYKAIATQEYLKDIIGDQTKAQIDLAKAHNRSVESNEKLKKAEKELKELNDKRTKAIANESAGVGIYREEIDKVREKVDAYRETKEKLEKEEKKLKKTVNESKEEYTETQKVLEEYTLGANMTAEQITKTADAHRQATSSMTEDETSLSESYQQASENIKVSSDDLLSTINNQLSGFDAFEQEQITNMDEYQNQLQANLDSQVQALQDWNNNLEGLADRTDVTINDELLAYLANLGPEGANYVKALNEMSTEELTKFNDTWKTKTNLSTDVSANISDTVNQMTGKMNGIGTNIGDGLAAGITAGSGKAKKAAKKMSDDTISSSKNALGIHSPSTKFKSIGKNVVDGLANGVSSNKNKVKISVNNMCNDATSGASARLNTSTLSSAGYNVVLGLAKGIDDNSHLVSEAVQRMASKAAKQANITLEIHSPSKVFARTGKYMAQGMAVGFEQEMNNTNAIIADSVQIPNDATIGANNKTTVSFNASNSQIGEVLTLLKGYLPNIGKGTTTVHIGNEKFNDYIVERATNGLKDIIKANNRAYGVI